VALAVMVRGSGALSLDHLLAEKGTSQPSTPTLLSR